MRIAQGKTAFAVRFTAVVALLALAGTSSALANGRGQAARPKPNLGSRIGGGARADVHSVSDPARPNHTIVKVLRPASWARNRLRVRTQKEIRQYVQASVAASKALSADAAFVARFGSIVTPAEAHSTEPTWLLRQPAAGVEIDSLPADKQAVARREIKAAVKMARRLVRGRIDGAEDNFRFDRNTGKITAWWSVVPQPTGKTLDVIRTVEEPLGRGVNTIAYRATQGGKKKVVKLMKLYDSYRVPEIATEAELEKITDAFVSSVKTLRSHPDIIRRFGADVIPDADSPAPGVLVVDEVEGVPYTSLSGAARTKADKEVADLLEMARRILPQHVMGGGKNHFFFNTDGTIAGWFDHISDSKNHYTKDTR
ncbi:MAG TPA: hypothetical protein VFU21_13035 [Kofleriaceae bacterium]|nr:hypothetical protein [Kofleriaceae bacterium]